MDRQPDSAQLWAELLELETDDGEHDDDRALALVSELNRRGESDVVEWALPTLSSSVPWHRQAAAWVLGQHGGADGRPFGARVMPVLIAAARKESDDRTRESMVVAIGHADDPAWADQLMHYATDSYPPIREAVAGALPIMFAGEDMDQKAIDTLIALTDDPDRYVRDWATMSLGTQTEQDSDAIRAALRARLDDDEDKDDETATTGEAALGLALRHDARVYPYLERWLAAPAADIGNLTVEAAGAFGDRRLLPALRKLRTTDWQKTDPLPYVLDDAIAALESLE